jgi:hypothetical protein
MYKLIYSFLITTTIFLNGLSNTESERLFPLSENWVISTNITDQDNNPIIGANVVFKQNPNFSTITDRNGDFSISIPKTFSLPLIFEISYVGYQSLDWIYDGENTKVKIILQENTSLTEIEIIGNKFENIHSDKMGTTKLTMKEVKNLPVLMGEVDILKTIDLLPGVNSGGEGNSGFFVRGGSADQNLVLLDEATIYNPGHLFGFFSVFNADAIKGFELQKGSIGAEYGGRISSVLKVEQNGGADQFEINGGVGLLSSRLSLKGPLKFSKKNNPTFMIAARRTYVFDLAQPFINTTDFKGTNYFFYDLNGKIDWNLNRKNKLSFSSYHGTDQINFAIQDRNFAFEIPYSNTAQTLKWTYMPNSKSILSNSITHNKYNFKFQGNQSEFSIGLRSGIETFGYKSKLDRELTKELSWNAGVQIQYHILTPNRASLDNGELIFQNRFPTRNAIESGVFTQLSYEPNENWLFVTGLRYSNYRESITKEFFEGDDLSNFGGIEPRVNIRYAINRHSSLKGGWHLGRQYIHLVSNSTSTLPTDIWVSSGRRVNPQIGNQFSIGYFHDWAERGWSFSMETYYKSLQNQIDYRESYVNNVSEEIENDFVFGKGETYGIEWMAKKSAGKYTGWISYTLARTTRQFPEINNGNPFPAIFDRRHDLNLAGNYQLSKKWKLGAAFVFNSGNAFTPVESIFFIGDSPNLNYGSRNSARVPDYHRLDFSAEFTPKPNSKKRFKSSWVFNIYNVYNQLNPFFIYYDLENNFNSTKVAAQANQVTLFPILPSITYNFSWK